MLNTVVPMFSDIFQKFDGELPMITQRVVAASEWISANGGYLFLFLLGTTLFLFLMRERNWFRQVTSWLMVRIPLFGGVIQKVYLARFCQSMHLLMAGHMPLIEAIEMVRHMVRFHPMEHSLEKVSKDLMSGTPLYSALSEHSIYPAQMISLIRVGEEVNQLESMFGKLSDQYSDDVEHSTNTIGSVLEPILIVFIGLFVGLIVVSMYLPLFKLSTTIG